MPKALERKLREEAKRRHFSPERADAYVYGTLRNRKARVDPPRRRRQKKTQQQGLARLLLDVLGVHHA